MDIYRIILFLGLIIKTSQNVYEVKTKGNLDIQNNWRPIPASGLQIPASYQFLNVANIDSPNNFRLGHLSSQRTQFFRHINRLIPPVTQYRHTFPYYSKPNTAKLTHKHPSIHLITRGTTASYTNFPSNVIKYNALVGSKPSIYVKHELPASNSQLNGIYSATINIPSLYKTFPVFKSTASSIGNIHDIPSLSTTHPTWMDPNTSLPKSQQTLNEGNKASGRFPMGGETISSYSVFGPALVRKQPSSEILVNSPETRTTTSTKLAFTLPIEAPLNPEEHAYTKLSSTPIPKHFWEDSRYPMQLKQELNQRDVLPYQTSINRPLSIQQNQQFVNYEFKSSKPLTTEEYSKFLVPPPLINREKTKNVSVSIQEIGGVTLLDEPREIKLLSQNLISTTNSTPHRHIEIKTEHIFLPDNKIFPLNIIFTTENPKTPKLTDNEEMTSHNYGEIEPLSNRANQFYPIIEGDYNSRHNFFTINDAITFPPYVNSTKETTNSTDKVVVSNYTPVKTTEDCINKKCNGTEITTKSPQNESVIAAVASIKTKGRRRRPHMRSKNTFISKQNSTEQLKKQAFLLNTTAINNTPIKIINQRKRARVSTTVVTSAPEVLTTYSSLKPEYEGRDKSKNLTHHFKKVSNSEIILSKETKLLESNKSNLVIQTTPMIIVKQLETLSTPSQVDIITTTCATPTSTLSNFTFKNINTEWKYSNDNVTENPILEKRLPVLRAERMKNMRHRQRLKLKTRQEPSPSFLSKNESGVNFTASPIETTAKTMHLKPVTSFDGKRPTFSVKDYKTHLRIQNKKRTTTIPPENLLILAAGYNSKSPNRKRLLPMIRIKPIANNNIVENKNETRLKVANNVTSESTIHQGRSKKTTESLPITTGVAVKRNNLRNSDIASNFTSKIRKNNTRPQYSTLRERIYKFQNNKSKTHESSDFRDDLLNITIDSKSDPVTETRKPESAIMKIAKQDNLRKFLHMLPDSKSTSEENLNKAASEISEHEAQLKITGISKDLSLKKKKNAIYPQMPEYFAIATDDPILPIEAFFPNVKNDKSMN